MKATQRDFAGQAAKAAQTARTFLFCGPDEAGGRDAADTIAGLLADAGERIELTGADLKRDPVRLGDEARSNSLFGGARHIFVRANGEEAAEAVEILLSGEAEACPVLIVAPGATDKGKTAKLLADRKDALVAMFWPPDLRSVAAQVRTLAGAAGLRIDGALAERIARGSGLDTRLARSELEKLALFLDASPQSPRTAEASALDAVGATMEDDGFAGIVNAVLGGDTARLPGELRRMRELGLNAVAVLLAFERRAAQIAALAAKLGKGGDIGPLLEAEKNARRISWKDQADLANQLRRWRGRRLERLVGRLAEMHRQLFANTQTAELLLAQGLSEIARAASARN